MSDSKNKTLSRFHAERQPDGKDGTARFRLEGHIDAEGAPVLIGELEALLDSSVRNVELDFSGVSFISSSGVGSLIASISEYREEGGDVVLRNMSSGLRSVFEMLDLMDYVTII